jgi:hypothetical protein
LGGELKLESNPAQYAEHSRFQPVEVAIRKRTERQTASPRIKESVELSRIVD